MERVVKRLSSGKIKKRDVKTKKLDRNLTQ
jgi:hypothetical protein